MPRSLATESFWIGFRWRAHWPARSARRLINVGAVLLGLFELDFEPSVQAAGHILKPTLASPTSNTSATSDPALLVKELAELES